MGRIGSGWGKSALLAEGRVGYLSGVRLTRMVNYTKNTLSFGCVGSRRGTSFWGMPVGRVYV